MNNLFGSSGSKGSNEPSLLDPYNNVTTTLTDFQLCAVPCNLSIPFDDGLVEDRAAIASNSHSQAEKRRRDRINAQLSNLRKLIPKSDRMDKAALLGRAIEEVKDLKLKSLEVSKNSIVPTEMDEVTIESDIDGNLMTNTISKSRGNTYIKASLCCEDSPELFSELIKVLKGLKLKVVRAEVASVGGRTKNVLVLCYKDNEKSSICLNTIKHSLKLVLSRFASSSSSLTSNSRTRSKRQRFFLPSH